VIDTQVTIGAIAAAVLLGVIAHEHKWLSRIRKQFRARRVIPPSKGALAAPDRSCDRLEDSWRKAGLL